MMKVFSRAALLTAVVFCFAVSFPQQAEARNHSNNNNDFVRVAQVRLKELGFFAGRVDGVEGPVTDRAIANFQRSYGLSVTGQLTPETFSALSQDSRFAARENRYYYPVAQSAHPVVYDHPVYTMSYTGVTEGRFYVTPDHRVVGSAPMARD